MQPVSINYHHDPANHGLLLGYAALNEKDMVKAIEGLKRAFLEFEKSCSGHRDRRFGSPKNPQSGSVDTGVKELL